MAWAATRLGAGGWRQLEDSAQWTGPSPAECAALTGRRVIIDVAHHPTALQVRPWPCPIRSAYADL
jgi:hypothetical protein